MMTSARTAAASVLGAFVPLFFVSSAVGQGSREAVRETVREDSVTISAGERYGAGGMKRMLLGSVYRDVWATPIRVPVLDPDTFAGGLTLLQEGGGRQTSSLRFGAKGDQEFVFRSVDKEQTGGLHSDLHDTVLDDIIQDQISSKHPGAALVVAPLLDAAGVLHAEPRVAVMADDPALGEFRTEFAGLLGTIEERPTETKGVGRFGRYERVIGTDRLLERVEESAEDRVDAAAFLTARLMDILIGDWDRHEDQWRWAQTNVGDRRVWLPIPRDRDNAFFHADGMVGFVGRGIRPYVVRFDETYPDLLGLTYNSTSLDRRFLPELTRQEWDSVTAEVQRKLTDEVIADAVRRLPEPYYEATGAELERKLRARRDALPQVSDEFYRQLMTDVDVYGTDESDLALVERNSDGTVSVRLGTSERGTYFERTFDPTETREVRLYLQGDPDTTTVRGAGPSRIVVRVIGGGDDDRFEDITSAGAGPTLFYDDPEGDDEFEVGPNTRIDTRRFTMPEEDTVTQNNPPPARDWGSRPRVFIPVVDWRSDIGPVVGVGPRWTEYGFRRFPYARRTSVTLITAPLETRFGIEAQLHSIRTGGGGGYRIKAVASQVSATRFHGFGNDTEDGPDPDLQKVWANELSASAHVIEVFAPGIEAEIGPAVVFLDPDPDAGSAADILRPLGADDFTLAGISGAATYDRRDDEYFPMSGAYVEVESEWYPLTLGDADGFVRSGIVAALYRSVPLPIQTVLALRAGGETLWGDAPFQFAPSVGGSSTLRGYRTNRFTGDASLFGSVELRSLIGEINLRISRGDFGTILLADIARVFLDEGGSDEWHPAFGGGLWFGPLDHEYTVHALAAYGSRLKLSAGIGMPF